MKDPFLLFSYLLNLGDSATPNATGNTNTNMHLQSLFLAFLCSHAAASAFAYPEAGDEHELHIRNPAVAVHDLSRNNYHPIFYQGESVRSARSPHLEEQHDLSIRTPPQPKKSSKSSTSEKLNAMRETYARKSTVRPRSPADMHIPFSRRYTPAVCAEPECEKICICYQRPGEKESKLVSYPWLRPGISCIDVCMYEACSCSAHKAS